MIPLSIEQQQQGALAALLGGGLSGGLAQQAPIGVPLRDLMRQQPMQLQDEMAAYARAEARLEWSRKPIIFIDRLREEIDNWLHS